jgi:hypothetical protein
MNNCWQERHQRVETHFVDGVFRAEKCRAIVILRASPRVCRKDIRAAEYADRGVPGIADYMAIATGDEHEIAPAQGNLLSSDGQR